MRFFRYLLLLCQSALFFAAGTNAWGQGAPPTITAQPVSQTAQIGGSVTFTVGATGASSYQWLFNGAGISGGTNPALTLTNLTSYQAGIYSVVLSNSAGAITSGQATLTVVPPLTLTSATSVSGYVGIPFLYAIQTNGSATTYTATGLPAGLTLNPSTGIIAGMPTAAGTTTAPISASTATQTVTSSLVIVVSPPPQVPAISTIATGFVGIAGITGDSAGNYYVTDTDNTVSKITPSGVITLLAGNGGQSGGFDGPGTGARFNAPAGIAIDSNGNLYVADSGNSAIRKITPDGTVSTLAGFAGLTGSTDGIGNAARFNHPLGVSVDKNGNVFVADSGNATIREITPTGSVSTLAGTVGQTGEVDGLGAAARFTSPSNLGIDGNGNLYAFDPGAGAVRKITPAGLVSTLESGIYTTSDVFNLTTSQPADGIAVDNGGDVFVAVGISSSASTPGNDFESESVGELSSAGALVSIYSITIPLKSGVLPFGGGRITSIWADRSGNVIVGANGLYRITNQQVFGPSITIQPLSVGTAPGQSPSFSVGASSNPAATYQWQFNGASIANATAATLNLTNVTASQAGTYTVLVSNGYGTVASAPAVLTVSTVPVITTQPQPQSASTGGAITLTANSWPGASYQWSLNGTAIPGANSNTLVLTNIGSDQAGSYQATVTNANGSATSNGATIAVSTDAHLINLSSHAFVPAGGSMTAGFVVSGSGQSFATGQGQKSVLIRGVGPTLSQFGITDALAAPQLTLFNGLSAVIDSNATWGGTTTLTNAFVRVYAFPLPPRSKDTALLETLNPGSYTALVSAPSAAGGTALAEIYDADQTPSGVYLINISTLGQVDSSGHTLVAGFVITGTASETVLIRGIGPTLSQYGVATPLATPALTLFDSNGNTLAANAGWGGSESLATAFARVHAFALPTTSADTAIEMTLAPGTYTAQVSGLAGATGNHALVEIYEVK